MAHQVSSRRLHSAELKAAVLAQCAQPGASVAAIALAYGLNANLVHNWRRLACQVDPAPPPSAEPPFFPLPSVPAPVSPAADIRIELRRSPMTVNLAWPASSAAECAQWLRELLR